MKITALKVLVLLVVVLISLSASLSVSAGIPLIPHVIVGEVAVTNGTPVVVIVDDGEEFETVVFNESFTVILDSGEDYWSGNKISFFIGEKEAYEKWIFRHGAIDRVSLTFVETIFDEFKNKESIISCTD